jgi:hypothetical protein
MAEANCTWCVAGKYQSGSGLNTVFCLYFLFNLRIHLFFTLTISERTVWSSSNIFLSSVACREELRYQGLAVSSESEKQTQRRTRRASQQEGADGSYLGCCVTVASCEFHPCTVEHALILHMHGAGLTKEAGCSWCAPGKYQTGVGLMAEANCMWCVAGKYQSGSGLNTAFWLSPPTTTPVTDIDDNRY